MNKKRRSNSEIFIDESKQVAASGLFQRLKNTFMAVVMGIVFAQVMLFAFGFGSIVLWWDNIIFGSYLIICAILGWIVGEKFIQTLGKKSEDWWDLWGHWRP